eukprot:Gb_22328 [translate_table: standard]
MSKFLYVDTNGACDQSVFTSPPFVAHSSAFHMDEYTPIPFLFGNATPLFSLFLNTRIGTSSTKNTTWWRFQRKE